MKPENILNAPWLDILFENRNKEYGAYELRSNYERRLVKAMGIILLTVIALFLLNILKNRYPDRIQRLVGPVIPPDTRLIDVTIAKEMTVMPAKKMVKAVSAPTVADTKPLIVPDPLADKPVPDQADLDTKMPAAVASDGTPGYEGPSNSGNGVAATGAATGVAEPEKEQVLEIAEIEPEFPGGLAALSRFLSRNLHAPTDDLEPGSQVRVVAKFVVDKEGAVIGIEMLESGGAKFDDEVMRVMKKMPRWKPGRQNGTNVSVYYRIPVVFKASE